MIFVFIVRFCNSSLFLYTRNNLLKQTRCCCFLIFVSITSNKGKSLAEQ